MVLGLDKCRKLNIRHGKAELEGFEIWQGNIINENDNYKYPAILESGQIQHTTNENQLTIALTITLHNY